MPMLPDIDSLTITAKDLDLIVRVRPPFTCTVKERGM